MNPLTSHTIGQGIFFNRKLRSLLKKRSAGRKMSGGHLLCADRSGTKTRTRAKWKFVAKATALGARVPQAELFVPLLRIS